VGLLWANEMPVSSCRLFSAGSILASVSVLWPVNTLKLIGAITRRGKENYLLLRYRICFIVDENISMENGEHSWQRVDIWGI
jgi:hypothetical protein